MITPLYATSATNPGSACAQRGSRASKTCGSSGDSLPFSPGYIKKPEGQVTKEHMTDLIAAGLLHDHGEHRLTVKGRDWLRVLEDALTQEIASTAQSDEDFVQSTNGLFR